MIRSIFLLFYLVSGSGRALKRKEADRQRSLDIERWLKKKFREGFVNMKNSFEELDPDNTGMVG